MVPNILLQILLTPLAASILIIALRKVVPRAAGWISSLALVYSSVLIVLAGIRVYAGEVIVEKYFTLAPNIEFSLLADGLSLPTIAIINLLCAALSFYAIHYIEHRIEIIYKNDDQKTQDGYFARFYYLFLLFPLGFMGVTLSTNLVTLYFFLEVLTVTLYFLMAWFGYRERVRVAGICLVWGIMSALLVLTGTFIAYSVTGSFEIADMHKLAGTSAAIPVIALVVLGMMAKLAVVPFHVWMPWVHAEHPTCIAGLLAVYANLALYILIRVLVIPLHADFAPFATPILVMALITMVYGSLLTTAQTDIKRLAACSTISQIAYSVMGLGAFTVVSMEGGMFFFLSHIMGKTIFFSTAGIVVYTTGIRNLNDLGGLAKKMPATTVLWACGAMMLSGFPPFSSFTAEWIMFTGIFENGLLNSPLNLVVAIVGILAIMLTVGYTFSGMRKIFFGPLSDTLAKKDLKDPPLLMLVPLYAIVLCSVFLGLYPSVIMNFFHSVLGNL